jgi:hypothetical protein
MKKIIILFAIFLIAISIRLYLTNYFQREIITEGVKGNSIYFGETINLNDSISLSYSNGIVLAFQMINRFGGINGRDLNLFIYDDDYNKEKAVKNARILLEYDNVLGLIGTWGTATSYAIYDQVIGQKDIPFIAPLTGSNLIKSEPDNIIMLRPSYYSEISLVLKHINSLGLKNLGVIYQNDEYGISCFNDLSEIYSTNNYSINIIPATYERNTTYLYDTYKKLLNNEEPFVDSYNRNNAVLNIDAIFLLGTSKQEIYIINYFKKLKPSMYFYNISFVGENVEKLKNIKNKSNIYITNVINVNNTSFPLLYKNLINEMKFSNNTNKTLGVPINLNQNLIEGFIAGLFTANILKKMDPNDINRKNFIKQLYSQTEGENYVQVFDMKIGPFISSKISRGLHKIYLCKYNEETGQYNVILESKEIAT